MVDVHFDFQSDDDGRNGINDGFKGIGFNNIPCRNTPSSRTCLHRFPNQRRCRRSRYHRYRSHEFFSGVYRLDVKTTFDNTTIGSLGTTTTNCRRPTTSSAISTLNRLTSPLKADILFATTTRAWLCVLPIDSALTHSTSTTNGVLAGDYVFYMEVTDMADAASTHVTGQAVSSKASRRPRSPSRLGTDGWTVKHTTSVSTAASQTAPKPATSATHAFCRPR